MKSEIEKWNIFLVDARNSFVTDVNNCVVVNVSSMNKILFSFMRHRKHRATTIRLVHIKTRP